MGSKITDQTTNIYLQTLKQINDELTNAFDSQLDKLKQEEKQLQDFLRLKTRHDLINSMEKELQINGDLNEVAELLEYTTTNNNNFSVTNDSISNTANLDDIIRLSNDSLIKSYMIKDKLSRSIRVEPDECSICEQPVDTNNSPVNTEEFLKNTVYSNLAKPNLSLRFINNPEPVKPNLIYSNKNSTRKLIREPSRRVSFEMKPSNQDLKKQQTLVYDENLVRLVAHQRAGSRADLSRVIVNQQPGLAWSLNGKRPAATSANVFDRLYHSQTSTEPIRIYDYIRLPVGRTLIHDKAWAPGKVNTIYYPYRDFKLNRSSHNNF